MKRLVHHLNGAAIAAGLMYYFDPVLGRRRRSLLRDQLIHAMTKTSRGADATYRDMQHRLYGTYAELRGALRRDDAPDEVIAERVRAKIGRYVSHPSAIEVDVHNRIATVSGPILAHEVDGMLCAVESVRGVEGVEDRLEVHPSAKNISALQGGQPPPGEPMAFMQTYWTPTTRLAAGTLGGLLMINCAAKRNVTSPLLGTLGFGLMLRAVTNLEVKRLLGLSGRRGVDVHKTVHIERPVAEVFGLLADPKSYPEFTDFVTSVREFSGGHYQKTLCGPAGTEITLHEVITRYEPNEFVAFRSAPDSPIQYAGRARFTDLDGSRTKIEIDATYNPPGGVLSHSTARLAGMDLKSRLEEVLMRAKSYLETGVQPHDAAQPESRSRRAEAQQASAQSQYANAETTESTSAGHQL